MLKLPRIFNRVGKGGPGRLLLISGSAVGIIVAVGMIATHQHDVLPQSDPAKIGVVNPLPGGLHTNPEQNLLASETDREAARKALAAGTSYTPPMSPGVPLQPSAEVGTPPVVAPGAAAPVIAATRPPPAFKLLKETPLEPVKTDARFAADPTDAQQRFVRRAAANPQDEALYRKAVDKVLAGWGGHIPRTDVQEAAAPADGTTARADPLQRPSSSNRPVLSEASSRVPERAAARVLIPAGRGIYAHTIVSVDSDSGGSIVLEADSGPIAGDRMIGMFSKAGGHENLLVVQVTKVIHRGEEIGASGVVISPSTMQTAVASSVDQHYLTRFALPAAAAFVQGLGSALATTSNSVGEIGPLGNTSFLTRLSLPQQLGVGAGAAAQQIGTALAQQAPTGPTIHLDANVNVGVMFLSDVKTTAE